MTPLEEAIAEFRKKLQALDVKFLLVYSYKNLIKDTLDTQIASNADQFGIRMILTAILRPTKQAILVIEQALRDVALASAGVLPEAVRAASGDGTFLKAAANVFEKIRPLMTIYGWETEQGPNARPH